MPQDVLTIPEHLEEVFVVWGPPTFRRLVRENGGKIRASDIAGVSSSTMSRWAQSPPGVPFGQRRDMRSYRSLWFGYPGPFPGLDRIVEEICGFEHSFIGDAVARYGVEQALEKMRRPDSFGLQMLELENSDIVRAANSIGIPSNTRRRWTSKTPYPRQWAALDRLAETVDRTSWLESVMAQGETRMRSRKVSAGGIACIVQSVAAQLSIP